MKPTRKRIHFELSERKLLLRLFDVMVVLGAMYLLNSYLSFSYLKISINEWFSIVILSLYLLFFGQLFELYHLQKASKFETVISGVLLTTFFVVPVFLLTPVFAPIIPKQRTQLLLFFVGVLIPLLSWRLFYAHFLASHRFEKSILLIAKHDQVEALCEGLKNEDPHFHIKGYFDPSGINSSQSGIAGLHFDELTDFLKRNTIAEIVVALREPELITVPLYQFLIKQVESGMIIREYSQVYEERTLRIPVQYLAKDFYRYFPFSRNNHNRLYLFYTRSVELIIAVLGLSIGLLFIPFIMLLNGVANPGPLLYFQDRIGRNGRVFSILKLRTMVVNAEQNGAAFAKQNDRRITPFGKLLRRTRFDEFPQFYNIIRGDMALIGPRPERAVFVEQIADQMPFYETRHVVRPGITGWAQVNYSYGESVEDSLVKLQYDLYYIKHRGFFIDVIIILKTMKTILFYRGQ
ncbi:MAG: sugar transferase [Flavobacterium sp. BFFFF2]|nr:MAG: sugar transferase [Flavobacterium sp. BFFFF2]